MGQDLPPMPATKGTAPTFVVWAVKDPTSANLDRIQVIKGWSKNGRKCSLRHVVTSTHARMMLRWNAACLEAAE
jgi:hypothetical protein